MQLLKKGKTKDVYVLEDGNVYLQFKDTVTGNEDGSKDPGGNKVVGEIKGVGNYALAVSKYFFEKLQGYDIPTHYIDSNLDQGVMIVKPAIYFGKGLECIIRYKAYGSFIRRYSSYCNVGDELDEVYEITLKDDEKDDPVITKEILLKLKIMNDNQYQLMNTLARKVCTIVKDDLKDKGLDLVDIKVEIGLVNGEVTLIDEISGGNMRVYKDGVQLDYHTLSQLILKRGK